MEPGTPTVPERAALVQSDPSFSFSDDYLVALAEETGAVIVTGDVTGVPPWA
jgi:hypothetical protein